MGQNGTVGGRLVGFLVAERGERISECLGQQSPQQRSQHSHAAEVVADEAVAGAQQVQQQLPWSNPKSRLAKATAKPCSLRNIAAPSLNPSTV